MGYAQYKELDSSGVSWLQKKPSHWRIKRLKFSTDLINKKVSVEDSPLPYLGLEHIESWTGRKVEGEISNSEGLASSFVVGDVLFGRLRPYLAKVHLAQQDGLISSEALVIRSKDELDAEFLKYYMLSRDFINIVDSSTYGSKMPRASWDFIGNLPVLLPDVEEQKVIARFLDFKTAQIDALISKKKELLDKLAEKRTALISHAVTKGLDPSVAMKDSGVAWLGDIPAHWEAKRTKFAVSYIGSGKTPKGGSEVYVQEGIMILRSQNVHDKGLRLDDVAYITDEADSAQAASRVLAGDVLLNITGASIGRTSIVPTPFPQANVNQHVCILRPVRELVTSEYLHLLLCSRQAKDQISSLENGTSREGLNFTQVGGLLFAFPPVQEQVAIVLALAVKLEAIDRQSEKVLSVIERLVEYRSAVITNAVTGQIDVRGFAIPQIAERIAS
jgi:hypothetical protein